MGLIWLAQMRDSVHQMEFGVVLKLCVKVRWYLRFDICYTKDCWISSWPFLYSTELGSILESKFGNWTACILSFLAKDCGPIRTPINGTKHGTKTTYPSRVTVTCNSGFHLRGSSERECMSDGVWSGVEAYCEGNKWNLQRKWLFSIRGNFIIIWPKNGILNLACTSFFVQLKTVARLRFPQMDP